MAKDAKIEFLEDYAWLRVRLQEVDRELDKTVEESVNYGTALQERVKSTSLGSRTEHDAVDRIESDLHAEKKELQESMERIRRSIKGLKNQKEAILLNMIYVEGKSVKEISSLMNLSKDAVYRVRNNAINNLDMGV